MKENTNKNIKQGIDRLEEKHVKSFKEMNFEWTGSKK